MQNTLNFKQIIQSFTGLKVMVIGDVMTDSYVFGKVERISPEAPVPVVHITHKEDRPGGAANVAINIQALGAIPILCSVTGDDEQGRNFEKLLEIQKLSVNGIIKLAGRKTTVKTRVIGNNHQLLRVDDETVEDLDDDAAENFILKCVELMQSEKPAAIIFEDYDKGVLSASVIQNLTAAANKFNIPVAVDPKIKNFNTYKNVTLFKPNLHELKSGMGKGLVKSDTESLKKAVAPLLNDRNIKTVMVTLSEAGVFIATKDEALTLPAHVRNISDVSGAGDTVISVAALCMALNLPVSQIAGLANLAGGLVCEMVGVVPIDKTKLTEEAGKIQIPSGSVNS